MSTISKVPVVANTVTRLKNRLLQLLALYTPGATTTRVWLHRRRGVQIGEGVFIGTAAIIETEYPELVSIGDESSIGIRAVIIAHHAKRLGVSIGDQVFVGPGVIVLPGVTIGRGSVVTAGSVVTKTVGEQLMVQGNPARPIARCGKPLVEGVSHSEFLLALRPV